MNELFLAFSTNCCLVENMNTEDISEEDGQCEGENGGDRYEDYENGDDWSLLVADKADQAPGENICPVNVLPENSAC